MSNVTVNHSDLERTEAEARVPYRHPQPKESFPELVIPNAIPEDERLWVPQAGKCLVSSALPVGKPGILDEPVAGSQVGRAFAPSSSSAGSRLCAEGQLALPGT